MYALGYISFVCIHSFWDCFQSTNTCYYKVGGSTQIRDYYLSPVHSQILNNISSGAHGSQPDLSVAITELPVGRTKSVSPVVREICTRSVYSCLPVFFLWSIYPFCFIDSSLIPWESLVMGRPFVNCKGTFVQLQSGYAYHSHIMNTEQRTSVENESNRKYSLQNFSHFVPASIWNMACLLNYISPSPSRLLRCRRQNFTHYSLMMPYSVSYLAQHLFG